MGKVEVKQSILEEFLAAANELKIEGLIRNDDATFPDQRMTMPNYNFSTALAPYTGGGKVCEEIAIKEEPEIKSNEAEVRLAKSYKKEDIIYANLRNYTNRLSEASSDKPVEYVRKAYCYDKIIIKDVSQIKEKLEGLD